MSHTTMPEPPVEFTADDLALLDRTREIRGKIHAEMAKVIVGQKEVIDEILMTLFCDAHVLLTCEPGVTKGLLLWTLSKVLGLTFMRLQFTSDLLSEDITGSEVMEEDRTTGRMESRFLYGPIFCNMLLADAINCGPLDTQAVLLEAMQEGEVSVGERREKLERPFLVIGTQNFQDPEGTHPLLEAQQDRFLFNIYWECSDDQFLAQLSLLTTGQKEATVDTLLDRGEIERIQDLVRRIPIACLDRMDMERMQDLVRRVPVTSWARTARFLALAARAHAVLRGQPQASMEDIEAIAPSVLRHRMSAPIPPAPDANVRLCP